MDDLQVKSEISETWNNGADTYDSFVSHGVQTLEEKNLWIQIFKKFLPSTDKPLQILDVGCGTGAMGLIFSEMGHMVTGIDLSDRMMEHGIRKASKRGLPMIFQSGDAEHPPFPENSFDVVINRHLLWTLPHPEIALQSWKTIIRPGGRVFVIDGVWNEKSVKAAILRRISNTLGKIFDPKSIETLDYSVELRQTLPHMDGVSVVKAKKYFSDAGFLDISTENLLHIRKNQHLRLSWYQKISPAGTYYLISGTKHG